jgi:hypothetical protein
MKARLINACLSRPILRRLGGSVESLRVRVRPEDRA